MRDFNTPLSILDRSMRQKINKDIQDLNAELAQADLIDIYRMLHPKYTDYTFFQHYLALTLTLTTSLETNHSSAHGKERKS